MWFITNNMIYYYKLITYFDFELGRATYCVISNPCINCIASRKQCIAVNQDSNYIPLRCYSVVW